MSPKSHTNVLDVVRAVLQEALEVPVESIVPEAQIINDLGAESIDLLDIRFRIEKELGVKISNADLASAFGTAETAAEFQRAFTVGAMCDYLTTRIGESDG